MTDAAIKLSKVDGQGNVTRAGLAVPSADFQFWLPLLWQAGGTFVSDDGNAPLFNSPEGLAAGTFYLNLYQRVRSLGKLPGGGIVQGTYVMQYGNATLARQAIQGDPALAASIWVAPPMKRQQQAAATYTDWLAISTQSKHPKEAFALIRWLVRPDNLVAYNETFFFVPPRRATVSSDYVRQNLSLSQMIERVMPFAQAYPSFNASNRFVFAEAWRKAENQQSTPQQALNDFARGFVPLTQARGAGK